VGSYFSFSAFQFSAFCREGDCQQTADVLKTTHREAGEIIAIFTTIVSKVRRTL
jgi:hypothetical protein